MRGIRRDKHCLLSKCGDMGISFSAAREFPMTGIGSPKIASSFLESHRAERKGSGDVSANLRLYLHSAVNRRDCSYATGSDAGLLASRPSSRITQNLPVARSSSFCAKRFERRQCGARGVWLFPKQFGDFAEGLFTPKTILPPLGCGLFLTTTKR